MSDKKPFSVDLGGLKRQPKLESRETMRAAERAGDEMGFVDRSPKRKRGRPPSPRTGQVHAHVLPHVAEEIAAERERRGVTQGVLIEEAWALYQAKQGLKSKGNGSS